MLGRALSLFLCLLCFLLGCLVSSSGEATAEWNEPGLDLLPVDFFPNGSVANAAVSLVAFTSHKCSHCRALRPVLESVHRRLKHRKDNPAENSEFKDLVFGSADCERHPSLEKTYNVEAYPTLLVLQFGRVMWEYEGGTSLPSLWKLLRRLLRPPVTFVSHDDTRVADFGDWIPLAEFAQKSAQLQQTCVIRVARVDSSEQQALEDLSDELEDAVGDSFEINMDVALAVWPVRGNTHSNVAEGVYLTTCSDKERLLACFDPSHAASADALSEEPQPFLLPQRTSVGGVTFRAPSCCLGILPQTAVAAAASDANAAEVNVTDWIHKHTRPPVLQLTRHNMAQMVEEETSLVYMYVPIPSHLQACSALSPFESSFEDEDSETAALLALQRCLEDRQDHAERTHAESMRQFHECAIATGSKGPDSRPLVFAWVDAAHYPDAALRCAPITVFTDTAKERRRGCMDASGAARIRHDIADYGRMLRFVMGESMVGNHTGSHSVLDWIRQWRRWLALLLLGHLDMDLHIYGHLPTTIFEGNLTDFVNSFLDDTLQPVPAPPDLDHTCACLVAIAVLYMNLSLYRSRTGGHGHSHSHSHSHGRGSGSDSATMLLLGWGGLSAALVWNSLRSTPLLSCLFGDLQWNDLSAEQRVDGGVGVSVVAFNVAMYTVTRLRYSRTLIVSQVALAGAGRAMLWSSAATP